MTKETIGKEAPRGEADRTCSPTQVATFGQLEAVDAVSLLGSHDGVACEFMLEVIAAAIKDDLANLSDARRAESRYDGS